MAASVYIKLARLVNGLKAIPQNGQRHSNNLLAVADKLFECVSLFWFQYQNQNFIIKIVEGKLSKHIGLGETKLIGWCTSPTDPILSKNKKIILQNFC